MPKKAQPKKASDVSVLRKKLIQLKKLKDAKSAFEVQIKKLNEKIEPLMTDCFNDMTALDIQKLTMKDSTFYVTSRKFFSMMDKAKALAWIKKTNPELLSINHNTLNSFLTEWIKEQKKKPPACFKEFSKDSVGIRKINPKEDN